MPIVILNGNVTPNAMGKYKPGFAFGAASNLFAKMRKLDELMPDVIVAEWLPEEGLGIAINDRLRRAAAEE